MPCTMNILPNHKISNSFFNTITLIVINTTAIENYENNKISLVTNYLQLVDKSMSVYVYKACNIEW